MESSREEFTTPSKRQKGHDGFPTTVEAQTLQQPHAYPATSPPETTANSHTPGGTVMASPGMPMGASPAAAAAAAAASPVGVAAASPGGVPASPGSVPGVASSFSSHDPPCAACKSLRRKCTRECIFLPHFPRDEPDKFARVHKVFGASNVAKMLQELPLPQREDAVASLEYEAQARVQDPVYGCVGILCVLQRQVVALREQLAAAQAHAHLQGGSMGAAEMNGGQQLPAAAVAAAAAAAGGSQLATVPHVPNPPAEPL